MPTRQYIFEISPSPNQAKEIHEKLNIAAKYYNECCSYNEQRFVTLGKELNNYDLQAVAKNWRKALDPDKKLPSQTIQDVCTRYSLSLSQFYQRIKLGQKASKPHKKIAPAKSILFKQNAFHVNCKGDVLVSFNLGERFLKKPLRFTKRGLTLPKGANVNTALIKFTRGRFYLHLTCEVPDVRRTPKKPTSAKILYPYCDTTTNFVTKKKSVGIDPGVANTFSLSDGKQISCDLLIKEMDKLDSLNRARKHKERMHKKHNVTSSQSSRRYRKIKEKISWQHEKIKRIRLDFLNKFANFILDNYDNIYIEDFSIPKILKKAVNRRMRRLMLNVGFGKLMRILEYKAPIHGSAVTPVAPYYTSQMCTCGAHVPKTLGDREHNCTSCGLTLDRDLMSAQVIEILGDATHPQNSHLSVARDRLLAAKHASLLS